MTGNGGEKCFLFILKRFMNDLGIKTVERVGKKVLCNVTRDLKRQFENSEMMNKYSNYGFEI